MTDARIAHALVEERHQALYMNSALFHTSVDTLAQMLPLWLDGLAAHAADHQDQYNKTLRTLREGLGPPIYTIDDGKL